MKSCAKSFAHRLCKYRRPMLVTFGMIIIFFGWHLFIYWMDYFDPPVMVWTNGRHHNTLREQQPKKILYWNYFFDQKDYFFGFGTRPFTDRHCTATCETTDDREQYNTSEAIIFHIQTLRLSEMPKYRFPYQRWIFLMLESPDNTKPYNKLHYLNNTFNWTMTYRLDSDVHLPYGTFQKIPRNPSKAALNVDNFTKRTKSVMWVVSECSSYSRRELYVRELQKYIDVDIYGHCGKSCHNDEGDDECETVHLSTYKFYLAFENSLCKDYNTEKLFRGARKHGPIPIVFGSSNYSAIAPPKYYIDTKDFSSPKDLADYLKVLSQNASLYNQYNDWRNDYVVDGDSITTGFCSLCQKLNNDHSQMISEYPDIYDWWVVKGNCKTDGYI